MRCQRLVTEDRPGDLRQPVRDGDERLPRSAKRGRPVAFVHIAGFRLPLPARIGFPTHGTHGVSPLFRSVDSASTRLARAPAPVPPRPPPSNPTSPHPPPP